MRRRTFLAACLAAGAGGCLGDEEPGGAVGNPTSTATTQSGSSDAGSDATGGPATGTATDHAATATESPVTTSPTTAPTATATTPTATPPSVLSDYETTDVAVTTPDGERLGAVTAAIADTGDLRYTGLSEVEALPESYGMLFVYESVGDRTYVMREMDVGLDIVYADDEGTITRIHHAPEPGPDEVGGDQRYPGRGQYVLEVAYEWTMERGVEEGDVLEFDL